MPPLPIVCFGEILWDSLPEGLFPGGAPFNVAFHLRQLGATPALVSAVGRDWPGDELLRRLKTAGIATTAVARQDRPTGHVQARHGDHGDIAYTITRDVAWDAIPVPSRAAPARAIVFGSLAQRTPANRATLAALLAAHPRAWRVFDVNLRPPHTPARRVLALAQDADLLKVNEAELRLLAGSTPGTIEQLARRLATATRAKRLCVTLGSKGAALLAGDAWLVQPARPVRVASPIGAGDAFLAALLHGLLQPKLPAPAALARACRLAEHVASHTSATPPHPRRSKNT